MRDMRGVLLVEDSDADSEATRRALSGCRTSPPVHRCVDGDEALAYLRGRSIELDPASLPAVVLLDLNLPGTGGREVLREIKTDASLRHIPVVILTTSDDRSDVEYCYAHGASGYLTKPVNLAQFTKSVRDFCAYWFESAVLPTGSRSAFEAPDASEG